jgi:type I restriction enzyme S subunit
MNRTLEAIARAIFKSWFVDFEPFLDGEFVDSDLGPIPKGWEVRLFSDCVEILSGGTPKTSVLEYWGRDIPWVSAKDASASRNIYIVKTEKSITKAGVENSVTQILPRNTTIITARGTVGKIVLTSKPMAMNQSCYAIRGKEEFGPFFIHFSLRQLVDQLKQKVHGTVFDTITRSTFSTLKVLVPPKETRTKYETVVEAIMGQILVNTSECCYLARIRNDLLPKLLSGKTWAGGR